MIKQGAKLVESSADIIEELEPLKAVQFEHTPGAARIEVAPNLPEEEQQIYACLSSQPVHLEEIIQNTHLSYGRLLTSLLKLEHKKLVKELPGKFFVKT